MIFSVPLSSMSYLMDEWRTRSLEPQLQGTFSELPTGADVSIAVTETGSSGSGMVVTTRQIVFDIASKDFPGWAKTHSAEVSKITQFLSDLTSDPDSRVSGITIDTPRVAVVGETAITTFPCEIIFNEDILRS